MLIQPQQYSSAWVCIITPGCLFLQPSEIQDVSDRREADVSTCNLLNVIKFSLDSGRSVILVKQRIENVRRYLNLLNPVEYSQMMTLTSLAGSTEQYLI